MKKTTLFMFLLLAFAGLVQAQTDEWIDYSSTDGNFSVSLPSQPKTSTQSGEGQPKDVNTGKPLEKTVKYTYSDITSIDGQSFYLIGWVDYQADFNFNPKGELEANRDNFINGIGATITSQKSINLGTYEGLEFNAEKDNAFIKGKVYIIGKRPYILISVTREEDDTDVGKFFDSFKLGKKK